MINIYYYDIIYIYYYKYAAGKQPARTQYLEKRGHGLFFADQYHDKNGDEFNRTNDSGHPYMQKAGDT